MKPLPKFFSLTRRDLLIHYGGEQHATHTVVRKIKAQQGRFIVCSCDTAIEVPEAAEVNHALRNVALVVPA